MVTDSRMTSPSCPVMIARPLPPDHAFATPFEQLALDVEQFSTTQRPREAGNPESTTPSTSSTTSHYDPLHGIQRRAALNALKSRLRRAKAVRALAASFRPSSCGREKVIQFKTNC